MKKKTKCFLRRALSTLLALALCLGMIPFSASAASQENTYHDPADSWLNAAGRANEFNANATVTEGTMYCRYCTKEQNGSAGAEPHVFTPCRTFRVPEYTSDGISNATRNIRYSDGVMIDEASTANVMFTSPNHGGVYTNYHWTKSLCLKCGRLNTNTDTTDHSYLLDVYALFDCASDFEQETLPESSSWEYLDDTYHYKTTTTGSYCGFCFGTHKESETKLERHTAKSEVIPQLGNQRFAVVEHCTGCDLTNNHFTAAKAVVASYYGVADGQPHTVTVTDLCEPGVTAAIRYGDTAENCNQTTAPNFIEPGQYTVYYQVTYAYKGESMTENGAAYVWLRDETPDPGNGTCADGAHQYTLLETVSPSCQTLGYTRYLCVDCGKIEKRDYTAALGHNWQGIQIREATCETDGKVLNICSRCGLTETEGTPRTEHEFSTHSVKATCTNPGYTLRECSVCGERQVTDITDVLPHDYKEKVTSPTCEIEGWTTHLCEACGSSFVTDHTQPLGHNWNSGAAIANPSCTGEGVKRYTCTRCKKSELEKIPAVGHTPGKGATCLNPGTCTVCGAVLEDHLGHSYKPEVTSPTCTKMGYTVYTCASCGDSYKSDYTDPTGHTPGEWIVDKEPTMENHGSRHKECVNCGETLETEDIPTLPAEEHSAYVKGYPNGTFGPETSMTRSEAAAVFARLLAAKNGDILYDNVHCSFSDVSGKAWYAGSVKYLETFDILSGYSNGTFRPNAPITRAEFIAISVRFYEAYGVEVTDTAKKLAFTDVNSSYWAAGYIDKASTNGWVAGYGNGMFAPDKEISRAEVVTIVNRVLGREANQEDIAANLKTLTAFPDVPNSHWAYYAVLEAANAHVAPVDGAECWLGK